MSYWELHGVFGGLFFALFLFVLPRLTLFLTTSLWAVFTAWLTIPLGLTGYLAVIGHPVALALTLAGWILVFVFPRLPIALLATLLYVRTNPFLVVFAWAFAYVAFEMYRSAIPNAIDAFLKGLEKSAGERRQSGQRAPRGVREKSAEWWKILGVSKNASVEAIKAAYRKKAKRLHPDLPKNKGGNAEKFSKVTDAYNAALKDKNGT
ncbi:MAG: DnaJ domain-containing protein [Minisyncoccia bacterium]